MRESFLRDFFLGKISPAQLSEKVGVCVEQLDEITRRVHIARDLESEIVVNREMMLALCESVLAGELPPEDLRTIAFALIASDYFAWDGDTDEVLADVIHDWAAPEVNLPLTPDNMESFKKWLLGIEPYPERSSVDPNTPSDRLKSQTEAKFYD